MPIPVINFPIYPEHVTKSLMSGLGSGVNLYRDLLQSKKESLLNKYLEPTLQEQLDQLKSKSIVDKVAAQYAPDLTLADLLQKRASGGLTQQQSRLVGKQADYYAPSTLADIEYKKKLGEHLASQIQSEAIRNRFSEAAMPYEIESKRRAATSVSDPLLNRILELNLLKKYSEEGNVPRETYSTVESVIGASPSAQSRIPLQGLQQEFPSGIPEQLVQRTQQSQQQLQPSGTPESVLDQIGNIPQPKVGFSNSFINDSYNNQRMAQWAATGDISSGEFKTRAADWNKLLADANNRSKKARELKMELDSFKESYDKASHTGPIKGMVPKFMLSAEDQLADKAANRIVLSKQELFRGQGPMSNARMRIIRDSKVNRDMHREAVDKIYNQDMLLADSIIEENKFLNEARKAGYGPQDAIAMWNNIYDDKYGLGAKGSPVSSSSSNVGNTVTLLNTDTGETFIGDASKVSEALKRHPNLRVVK